MKWNESRVKSVLTNKCPKCHEGKVFKYKTIFHPKKFDKMYDTCSACGHKYELETGFFYGSMYASYATIVAFFVFAFVFNFLIYLLTPFCFYFIIIFYIFVVFSPF